jgi:hypothetical protein
MEKIADGLNNYTMMEEENIYREQLYLYRALQEMPIGTVNSNLNTKLTQSANYLNIASYESYMQAVYDNKIAEAKRINTSLQPTNKMEEILKEVNTIYLNSWAVGRYDLTSAEYNRLYDIACLEPMIYGEGVYTARVMTDYIVSNIKSSRRSEQEQIPEKSVYGDIYPNPTQQTATIDYKSETTSVLHIYNLSGQEVLNCVIEAGEGSFSFDVSRLDDGVYIYHIKNKTGIIKYGKFVIIK